MATWPNCSFMAIWQAPGAAAAADRSSRPAVSSNQINLSWNAVTNATSYNVKRSTTNGGPYAVIATGVTTTNYTTPAWPAEPFIIMWSAQ